MENTFKPGLIPDTLDPRDLWEDQLLGGEVSTAPLPSSYRIEGLKFEPQGSWPFCVSFATTKMVEQDIKKVTGGEVREFSQPHLFFHSGGNMTGSGFRANLATAVEKTQGLIEYSRFPMPSNLWDLSTFYKVQEEAKKVSFEGAHVTPGYFKINLDRESLKRAIMAYGPLLVGVRASDGYWADRAMRPVGKDDDHAVLLVGWDEDDDWVVFDSLTRETGFDGYHVLHRSYGFNTAYAITELPADWKEKQKEAQKNGFEHCLNHYGKPRNFELEQRVAVQLMDEFKKFNNQSVMEAAGKYWTVLVNMVAYGGYSISYTKFFKWQPGDVINFVYHWRRTGQFIFDPNKMRSEYP